MGEPIESVFIHFYSLDGTEHAFAHVGGSELDVLIPSDARPDAEYSCFVGGLSPNGSVLAYAGTADSCIEPPSSVQPPFEVTVVDLATGEELLRVDLGNRGEALWQIPQVDFDGGRIFVSQMGVPPMLLTLDGSIHEITWLPTWLWQLEIVDSGDECPYWGFADVGGQVYCIPPGEAVLWNAG